jgi:murein DD-endopeptidase MepM/ murein hydrolase activator NlpD
MRRSISPLVPALALVLATCDAVDDIRERMRGATPREDYVQALAGAGLLETALGRDWVAAAEAALNQPLPGEVPVEETGYLDPAEPHAIALRVRLQRGQRVAVRADLAPAADALLFLDVFRVDSADTAVPRHIAAADSGGRSLEFEPSRTADYIVRLQPELLRGGRYTLTVRSTPALAFPVHGVGTRAIGSRFGAPRDGGARDHHGIDIFAPRGTPVLASAPGIVNRVRETERGGRVVWLRDERRSLSLYYAHLDSQLVANGTRVAIGDTLGTVGNTGNARTTPPHLHFGIYRRGEGPIDPLPFVHTYRQTLRPLRADTALLGTWARIRTAASASGRRLQAGTPLRVRGAAEDRYRAELPDGSEVWIAAASVELARAAIAVVRATAGCTVRDRPVPNSAVIAQLPAAERIAVLGRFGAFRFVRAGGVRGWTDCV